MKREEMNDGAGREKLKLISKKKLVLQKLKPSRESKRAMIVGMSCQFATKTSTCIPLTLHLHELSAIKKGLLRAAIELGEVLEALSEEP